eukprot:gene14287-biopygen21627
MSAPTTAAPVSRCPSGCAGCFFHHDNFCDRTAERAVCESLIRLLASSPDLPPVWCAPLTTASQESSAPTTAAPVSTCIFD